MRSSIARMIVVIGLICSSNVCLGTCEANTFQDLIARSQSSVTVKRTYTLNTDVTATLEEGQAIQLDAESNPYDIEKYIICYYMDGQEGIIRLDTCLTDGTISGGGTKIGPTGQGNRTRSVSGVPYAAHVEWRIEQGKALVNFRTTKDSDNPKPMPEVDRIAGFVRLWSEVKYNFVFFSRMPELDWDKVLVDYLPQVQAAQTDVQYYQVLRRCMALLKDGHTEVWGPASVPSGTLPFSLERIEGMAVITAVADSNAVADGPRRKQLTQANLKCGEAVTHIDGRAVEDILEHDVYPYVCASTPQGRDLRAYPQLRAGPSGKEAVVRIKALDGSERQVTLTWGRYRMPRSIDDQPDLRELQDGILYFKASDFGSDDVVKKAEASMDRICAAKGLILDLRQNGGGSTSVGYALLSGMTDKPLQGAKWKTREYLPAYQAWGRPEQWHEGDHGVIQPRDGKRYPGPVVVLVGPSTCSAAEDFVTVFQCSGRGKVTGQPTNGSTGQPLPLELPGGGGARICTKWDTYPDGREFVGIGCIPDVEVIPTRADIAVGRDVVLEKAMVVLGVHPKQSATGKPSEQQRQSFNTEQTPYRLAATVREWDFKESVAPFTMMIDDPNEPNMVELRTRYGLEEVVRGAADEYEKLRLLLAWTQKRWKHNGNNNPSKSDPLTILKEAAEGKQFRCVEYAIVIAACARSLGMPSRTLGLKRPDVETAESGAGHVAAEIWLKQFGKWVFVDGQWGAIAENDGAPLNAVEFQDAIARKQPGLKIRLVAQGYEEDYAEWILPYLYYLDFNPGHLFYPSASQRRAPWPPTIMLVPKGAAKPKVFQRNNPIRDCTYISNPQAFYPQMNK